MPLFYVIACICKEKVLKLWQTYDVPKLHIETTVKIYYHNVTLNI